jgi:hypothetical protein
MNESEGRSMSPSQSSARLFGVMLAMGTLAVATSMGAHGAGNSSACQLLTHVQVSAAVGSDVDNGTSVPAVRDACVWRESGSARGEARPLVQVQVLSAQDFDRIKTFRAAISTTDSGIGDEAHYFRDGITGAFQLIVKAGNRYFSVVSWPAHPGSEQSEADDTRTKAIEKAIARALIGKT